MKKKFIVLLFLGYSFLTIGTRAKAGAGSPAYHNNSALCPLPTISVSTSKTVCSGVPVTLSAVGSPSGGTYLWTPGNLSTQSITVTPSTTTLYNVAYTNSCGTVTDTVTIFVNPVPTVTLSSSIVSGCPPFCTQFYGRSGPGNISISTWSWSFGDGSSDTVESPDHCYNNPGTYTVALTAQSTAGCSSTFQVLNMITVYPLPTAAFSFSPNPVTTLYPTVYFTDNSGGSYKITNWAWTFGDGGDTIIKTQNTEHKYGDTGYYCATLTVEDINGCADTATQCFEVSSVYSFFIPDAFTPNADGKNDVFLPHGTDVSRFEMYIYDRWGMQILHTTDITAGWNGSVNNSGAVCQEDSYVYVINVTDNHRKSYNYKGAIYLVK